MKLKDAYLGIMLVAIVVLIVFTPPKIVIDFLLMVNIGISLLILLNAFYATEALDMSLFPTVLLIMTLFRMVMSLATTKLILLRGDAGAVVDTFGQFVAGNNMVVGIIVFIIIVIVNFLVITKGSERIAEVTARFTLDAMPGKQMAIDADLNTGLIDEQEAKERRKKIQDESNFYGAMDGASKFVKNDAIAGILIVFVNLIGGVALGATGAATGEALSIGDALNHYALLTIGGGLVHIIPSLLIATATGLLVTKATTDSNISAAVTKQLLNHPLVLIITGAALAFMGLFTPLPIYVFLPFGLLIIYLGYAMNRRTKLASIETEITTDDAEADVIRNPDSMVSLLSVDPIVIKLGYGLLSLVEARMGGDLLERVYMIRRQIAMELGTLVPTVRIQDDIRLAPNKYTIHIKNVEVAGGEIMFDHYMAMNSGYVEEEIDGIETVEPYMGLPALWITESQRERAEALGYTVVDPPAIIATLITKVLTQHLHELLSRQNVQTLIDHVKETHSVLIDELVPKMMSVGEIQKVLSKLLREGVSIRDLVTIMETLADYFPVTRDTDMLTEYVRQNLKRAISAKFFSQGTNTVITLDPELERIMLNNIQRTELGSFVQFDNSMQQRLVESLKREINKLTSTGVVPIILTSPFVRMYFKQWVDELAPDLIVLSYNELDQTVEVQPVGMVTA
ncbi:MAG: flagellar biosynthesis protein FlhA [Defluviitaleaceae bacterium]|nr:flagellar biosynthesis protein FlhA [Defluviitaleaceae bacterium]